MFCLLVQLRLCPFGEIFKLGETSVCLLVQVVSSHFAYTRKKSVSAVEEASRSWPSATFISLLRFRFVVGPWPPCEALAGIQMRIPRGIFCRVVRDSSIKSSVHDSAFFNSAAALLLLLGPILEVPGSFVFLLLIGLFILLPLAVLVIEARRFGGGRRLPKHQLLKKRN